MNANSDNPRIGKRFEGLVRNWAEEQFNCLFVPESPVLIGDPPKPHKFDLVSADGRVAVECKCYTWTDSGNVPSAKIATLDEAVLYMRSIKYPAQKIIAMRYARHDKKQITLAEYFCERKGHLLADISVWEIDDAGNAWLVRDGSKEDKEKI